MNCLGKIVLCLASGLVLNTGARADDSVLPNNPYVPIVVRNVFGLNPAPTNDAANTQEPPPKITPNGIMSIFGQLQVLYKVAGTAKAGQPAKDDSYILSEGQRQDDIEVIHIDEKTSLITFNNHGTVQELPLANAPKISTPPPNVDNSIRGRFGGRPAAGQLTTVPTRASPTQPAMAPEVQMIMIAAQHAKAQQEGDPVAKIYPATPIDAEAGIVPPSPPQ
jgi:hypothetical protein